MPQHPLINKSAYNSADRCWNVIIETPKGSRNKFKFDEDACCFTLSGVLPAGSSFPFDFGYLPGTKGADGDPLDVLVLMDEPAFPGCLIPARLIGAIEANQTELDGKTMRNDRLIAVAKQSHNHQNVKRLGDLESNLIKEIEHFFASYNQIRGKKFKVLARRDARAAEKLARQAMANE